MFQRVRDWFTSPRIIKLLEDIKMKQTELATQMDEQTALLQKIANESALNIQRINDLEAALQQLDNVSPEVMAALDRLKVGVKTIDDLTPDAEPGGGTGGETGGGETPPPSG